MLISGRSRTFAAALAALAILAVTACGSPSAPVAQPTSPPAATAAATAPSASAIVTPTAILSAAPSQTAVGVAASPPAVAVASPSPVAAASPTVGTSPAAVASAKPTTADEGLVLTFAPDGSEARYRVREQLAGRSLPSDAIGTTRGVTGSVAIGPSGAIIGDRSKIVVDLASLRSDSDRRDNWIRQNTLETGRFPTAEFVPGEARGLPTPLPTSGEAAFQLVRDLTVHGVTRLSTWDVTARFADREVTGLASTNLKITDFDMTPPRVGPVLSIEDDLTLEIDFRAARG